MRYETVFSNVRTFEHRDTAIMTSPAFLVEQGEPPRNALPSQVVGSDHMNRGRCATYSSLGARPRDDERGRQGPSRESTVKTGSRPGPAATAAGPPSPRQTNTQRSRREPVTAAFAAGAGDGASVRAARVQSCPALRAFAQTGPGFSASSASSTLVDGAATPVQRARSPWDLPTARTPRVRARGLRRRLEQLPAPLGAAGFAQNARGALGRLGLT